MRLMGQQSIVVALGVFLAGAAFAGGPTLEPGKWEFTTTVTMPTLPAPQTATKTECVTEAQSKDPLKAMGDNGTCTIKDRAEEGDKLTWAMECPGAAGGKPTSGRGELTAQGGTATGNMEMTMDAGGKPMTMKSTWSGKRLGACEEEKGKE